jgi:hypothetical protein
MCNNAIMPFNLKVLVVYLYLSTISFSRVLIYSDWFTVFLSNVHAVCYAVLISDFMCER